MVLLNFSGSHDASLSSVMRLRHWWTTSKFFYISRCEACSLWHEWGSHETLMIPSMSQHVAYNIQHELGNSRSFWFSSFLVPVLLSEIFVMTIPQELTW